MPKSLHRGKISENPHTVNDVLTDDSNVNKFVLVESLIDAHLIYKGQISGEPYEWLKAGSIVSVQSEDVPELLAKRLGGNTCCGGNRDGNQIFQLAQVEV